MQKIFEGLKFDIGLVGQTLNNSNVTGKYHSMVGWERAVAVLICGALAAGTTCLLEILEGEDSDGTSGALLTGAAATITANTNITEGTVDLGSSANTDVVTINGIAFTQAAATSAADREFQNAAGLKTCVEDATYGVAGVEASVAGDVVTLMADPLGDVVITVSKTENAGTITLATTKAIAYVEIENMDLSGDNNHIAAKVTSTGNGVVAVALLRGPHKNAITQKVGASAVV
jgi:hypothetical protein